MAIGNPFADQYQGFPPFICNGYHLPRCNKIAADDFESNSALKWETYTNKIYLLHKVENIVANAPQCFQKSFATYTSASV